MKKIVLPITSMVALALASSGLGAGSSYTPKSFDGTYRVQEYVTATVTCTTPPPVTRTTHSAFVLSVVNGMVEGHRIQMLGTQGRGSVDVTTAAPGFAWLKLHENLRFTIDSSGTRWVLGTLSGGGTVPGLQGGEQCVVRERGSIGRSSAKLK